MTKRIITAGLTIDLAHRTVVFDNEPIVIKGLTFDMLKALLEAEGQVVSIDALSRTVWKGKVVSDDTIAQRISLLRKALPDLPSGYVESVRSEGYRWLPDINKDDPDASPNGDLRFQVGIFSAVGIVLLVLLIYWSMQPSTPQDALNDLPRQADHGLDASVYTRVKVARAQQYASAGTQYTNQIAIDLYNELFKSYPDDTIIQFGLARTLLTGIYQFNVDSLSLSQANSLSQNLLASQPTNPDYLWLRGYYTEVSGNLDDAMVLYEEAVELAPTSAQKTLSLARVMALKGRLYEAARFALQNSGTDARTQFLRIADIQYLVGQLDVAKAWYEAALLVNPDDPETVLQYATYMMTNDVQQDASELLTRFHERHAGTVNSHLLVFLLAFERQDRLAINDALDKAYAIAPESLSVNAWRSWFIALDTEGISIPLSQYPLSEQQSPEAFVNKAVLAMANGERQSALVLLLRAQRLGYMDYRYLEFVPAFEPLRSDPIFVEILRTIEVKQRDARRFVETLTLPEL